MSMENAGAGNPLSPENVDNYLTDYGKKIIGRLDRLDQESLGKKLSDLEIQERIRNILEQTKNVEKSLDMVEKRLKVLREYRVREVQQLDQIKQEIEAIKIGIQALGGSGFPQGLFDGIERIMGEILLIISERRLSKSKHNLKFWANSVAEEEVEEYKAYVKLGNLNKDLNREAKKIAIEFAQYN